MKRSWNHFNTSRNTVFITKRNQSLIQLYQQQRASGLRQQRFFSTRV